MTCQDTERLADAYVDGELSADRAAELEAHLSTCAACTERVESLRALSGDLRAAPYFRAPAALVSAVTPRPAPKALLAPTWLPWTIAVAASVVAAVTLLRPLPSQMRATGEADAVVASHVRSLMANHLVDVESSDRHTVKPWFVGRLNFSPTVVDLASDGFPLVGGRLDYVDGHEAAALVYRRREHTINVWIWPVTDPTEALTTRDDPRGYHLAHWIRDGMCYWVASDVARPDLSDFSDRLIAATAKGL
jgi:anti-sigma factor RsiW